MWYKKADMQYDVFHGTRNMESILDKGFVYDFLGKGMDQYGPGFYFTTSQATAQRYSEDAGTINQPRIEDAGKPGIIRAKLSINKPIRANASKINGGVFDTFPVLNYTQCRQMIALAVQLGGDQVLNDWGDVQFEGKDKVINAAAKSYATKSSAYIMYDFFKNNLPQALKFITQSTGYDGVIVKHNNKENWVIAWYPEQIQVIR